MDLFDYFRDSINALSLDADKIVKDFQTAQDQVNNFKQRNPYEATQAGHKQYEYDVNELQRQLLSLEEKLKVITSPKARCFEVYGYRRTYPTNYIIEIFYVRLGTGKWLIEYWHNGSLSHAQYGLDTERICGQMLRYYSRKSLYVRMSTEEVSKRGYTIGHLVSNGYGL